MVGPSRNSMRSINFSSVTLHHSRMFDPFVVAGLLSVYGVKKSPPRREPGAGVKAAARRPGGDHQAASASRRRFLPRIFGGQGSFASAFKAPPLTC